ncbi:hypothetical protein BJV74DRAFT_762820 [Russula compacta]|nr:hypothetical protein BJV74DRAFT_762820 [Russula compacta]
MISFPRHALTLLLFFLSLSSFVHSAAVPTYDHHAHTHDHASQGALPDRWYHDDDHFAHALFKRQSTASPTFPEVGSPTWSAAYPSDTPDSSAMPQSWQDALNAAVQAGKIPNIPPSTQPSPAANPVYSASFDPTSPQVCSGSYGCQINGSIYNAPAGHLGLGFDDGPLPPSDNLYAFLRENELRATHFFIGINIIAHWPEFNTAFQTNQDDIAVHTWTHPYMTTLSNADVVAQLGWTLQLIYNSTGGRLARYWRPPYGDTDMRVTTIAQEVFGLTAIVWNNDSEDWTLDTPGGTTLDAIQTNFQQWLSGPQTTGLIVLEHELTNDSVQAFMNAYPLMKQYNWTLQSVSELYSPSAYQNAAGPTDQPTFVPITAAGNGGAGLITSTSSSSSSTPPPSPTNTSSSKGTSLPDSGVKKGAASRTSPLTLSAPLLALLFTLCLI